MDFKEAYKFPLKYDGRGTVWTVDDNMAFNWPDDTLSDDPVTLSEGVRHLIVDTINGEEGYHHIKVTMWNIEYNKNESIITHNGKDLLLIRGWGHLTGQGGLRLSEDEATRIQEEFAEYIIKQLS